MSKIKVFISLMLLGYCVSAYSIDYHVFNFNTLSPVENANITLNNGTYEISTITDAYGTGVLSSDTMDYSVKVWRSGYFSYDSILNVTNDSIETIYLNPSSTEGIIRIRVIDLTAFGGHQYCLYFQSNNRLQGCYLLNDTLTIHNNINYTWIPMLDKTDLISTPGGFTKYFWLYIETIFGYAALFALVGGFFYAIWHLIIRGKK